MARSFGAPFRGSYSRPIRTVSPKGAVLREPLTHRTRESDSDDTPCYQRQNTEFAREDSTLVTDRFQGVLLTASLAHCWG